MKHKALLFDLDGVLVDTAKYHFIAWKELADGLGIPFTIQDNERLKGVSRLRSLEIILELGNRTMSDADKIACCEKKNNIYVRYIQNMAEDEILPGAKDFLLDAKIQGYRVALGSASKNTALILKRLHLTEYFDAVIDGTKVSKAKPDPEVFVQGAVALGVSPEDCIVFEDAAAGIQAAHAGGMAAVGIGSKEALPEADYHLPGFAGVTIKDVEAGLAR
ncbi:MAG: beta-phosphoglucomutase [Faecousia sp.]